MTNLDIFGVVMLVVLAVALITFKGRKTRDTAEESFTHGRLVNATVTAIEERTEDSKIHPRFPEDIARYYIKATWTDPQSQKTYTFTSNPLLKRPDNIQEGNHVKVRIDPEDPRAYQFEVAQ